MKYSLKGHKDRNRHKNKIKRSGQARLVYVKDINHKIRWGCDSVGTALNQNAAETGMTPQCGEEFFS